ncbi:glutathione S-transferase [Aspergillus taichungensis]|uniref:Glutathione S-transferase n=1 Tax=Aspergillus taichungensis TaxID=482145 RepID=A0A2J5I9U9_9EURO|nr:glutathione S-transferase [Aspergillus taichungensis]
MAPTPFGQIWSYPNNPRVMKAQAAANINNLSVPYVPDFVMRETNQTPSFLSKFPHGKVPAFESTDGKVTLFESDAIAQYIADSGPAAPQLLGETPLRRALIRQWICFADGDVQNPVVDLVLPRLKYRAFDAAVEETAIGKIERAFRTLEKTLENQEWLAGGEKLSLGDITVASALVWGFSTAIDKEIRDKYPKVMAWYARVVETEGVKEAFGELQYVVKREVPV